jgi:hypothetical protein
VGFSVFLAFVGSTMRAVSAQLSYNSTTRQPSVHGIVHPCRGVSNDIEQHLHVQRAVVLPIVNVGHGHDLEIVAEIITGVEKGPFPRPEEGDALRAVGRRALSLELGIVECG